MGTRSRDAIERWHHAARGECQERTGGLEATHIVSVFGGSVGTLRGGPKEVSVDVIDCRPYLNSAEARELAAEVRRCMPTVPVSVWKSTRRPGQWFVMVGPLRPETVEWLDARETDDGQGPID